MEFENRFDDDQVDVVDQTEETHEDGGQAGVVDQQETEAQKQAILDRAHQARSQQEMHEIVNSIVK